LLVRKQVRNIKPRILQSLVGFFDSVPKLMIGFVVGHIYLGKNGVDVERSGEFIRSSGVSQAQCGAPEEDQSHAMVKAGVQLKQNTLGIVHFSTESQRSGTAFPRRIPLEDTNRLP